MNRKRIVVGMLIAGLTLAAAIGLATAQEPEVRTGPQGDTAVEGAVDFYFLYQGVLREDGQLVTGSRDMVFTLYSDATCTTQVASPNPRPGVQVTNGLFSAEVSGSYGVNGQALWLGIDVTESRVGCQEIKAVPYALSLRPGAIVVSTESGVTALGGYNDATGGMAFGLSGYSDSPDGVGVYALGAEGGADLMLGSRAAADDGRITTNRNYPSSDLVLVAYGGVRVDLDENADDADADFEIYDKHDDLIFGVDDNGDVTLGATAADDDGRITTNPNYLSSDLALVAYGGVRVDLDENADDADADFEIYDKQDELIFGVDDSGDVTFGGSGLVTFPRPAYDSGWVAVSAGDCIDLTHNLGGNRDNYVVDLQFKGASGNPHVAGYGGYADGASSYGGDWRTLTSTEITLCRSANDALIPQMRVRIWMYP